MRPRRVRDHRFNRTSRDAAEAFTSAYLPEMYWGATIDAIREKDIREWVEAAMEHIKVWLGYGRGFYIHGDLNAGKSSLAALLLMDAACRCERCLWLPARDVPGVRFRDTARNERIADRLLAADLLVLDDLGSEKFNIKGAAGAALEATVRGMYDRRRSVIVTSNVAWGHLPVGYKDAPGFASVLKRCVVPVAIKNDQWPDGLEAAW